MDYSQNTVLSLEERIHAWKQKIEEHFEVINTIDLRDEGLLQTVTTLITHVGNNLSEVERIDRTERQEEVARYVRSIGALQVTLSHTLFALQTVDRTLKDVHALPLLERGEAIRLVHQNFYGCWGCLKEAMYAIEREKARGGSSRRDHSPDRATTFEERMRACKQKIEKHLLAIRRLDIRDEGLSPIVASLVTSVCKVKAEVERIGRSEQPEEVARYVSMDALQPLLYNTVLELQIADSLLKEAQTLPSLDIDSLVDMVLRPVLKCRMRCSDHLAEAVRAFKEETPVEGTSGL